jgi:hypothetical protein
VKEGQILIDLDPTIKQADVDSNIGSLRLQYLDRERLVDEFEGRNPGEGLSRSARKNKLQIPPALMAVQARLKSARESEHRAREEAQRLVIAQRESALTAAEAVLVKLERTHSIVKEQESSLKELYEGGFASRMEWRDKDKELLAAQQDIEAQKKQIQSARASLEEARKGLETLTHERDKSVLTDLVEREKTISSTEGEVTKARKRERPGARREPRHLSVPEVRDDPGKGDPFEPGRGGGREAGTGLPDADQHREARHAGGRKRRSGHSRDVRECGGQDRRPEDHRILPVADHQVCAGKLDAEVSGVIS